MKLTPLRGGCIGAPFRFVEHVWVGGKSLEPRRSLCQSLGVNNGAQLLQRWLLTLDLCAMNPSRLLEALAFAADKHRDQRRKDVEGSPYINHPIAVARVLAVEAQVTDEAILIAAVLHDTVEDTETAASDIARLFGEEVAQLVAEVTDDKSLPKQVRKDLQVHHAPMASSGAKRLKMADKICNVRDVTAHPPDSWSIDRRREYLRWAQQVVAGCRGVDDRLEHVFDETLRDGWESLGVDA